ncbi:MAG: radical SAM family heme chaperone HemW [Synoicihabitans sp.]
MRFFSMSFRIKIVVDTQHNQSPLAMSEMSLAAESTPTTPSAPLGLYVHVPFCATTCDFCAFYQTAPTADGIRNYLEGIAAEMALVTRDRPVSTIFWGGGTPGLLAPSQIEQLGGLVQKFAGDQIEEWSVEMAPASVTEARLRALRSIGVTRISMGAQSFDPELLDGLGRQHTREQVFRAYDRIRSMGFGSVNLDLMFALPGQSEEQWTTDMETAIDLAPDHLSTYCLTFEEDTKLWVQMSEGKVKLDPDHEARLYESTWAHLDAAGYRQYEVANFARDGHRCRHNLNTWHMHEWIGLGPSAAGQHNGKRAANPSDLSEWREGLAKSKRMTHDRVQLTDSLLAQDALIFGLRLTEGVDLDALSTRFPSDQWPAAKAALDDLIEEGLAEKFEELTRLTVRGRLLADSVGEMVMTVMDA